MWLEVIGLTILLIGALWQAKMSGWWDRQLPEWQSQIQEDVNLTVLNSLDNIAKIGISNDTKEKERIREDIRSKVNETVNKSLSERDKRDKAMENGQAAIFWSVRDLLMIVGALLLVVGKLVTLQGIKSEE